MLSQLNQTVTLDDPTAPVNFMIPELTMGLIKVGTYSFTYTVKDSVETSMTASANFEVVVACNRVSITFTDGTTS